MNLSQMSTTDLETELRGLYKQKNEISFNLRKICKQDKYKYFFMSSNKEPNQGSSQNDKTEIKSIVQNNQKFHTRKRNRDTDQEEFEIKNVNNLFLLIIHFYIQEVNYKFYD